MLKFRLKLKLKYYIALLLQHIRGKDVSMKTLWYVISSSVHKKIMLNYKMREICYLKKRLTISFSIEKKGV